MATTSIGELMLKMSIEGDRRVIDALQRVTKQNKELTDSTKASINSTATFSGVLNTLAKSFVALQIMDKFIDGLKAIGTYMWNGIKTGIKYNEELQMLNVMMASLTGSQEVANKLSKEMIILAAETPFAIKDFAQASKTLLGYGVVQEDIMETLNLIGNIAGGDAYAFQRLALAFGQVTAKGKLQAEEVRQMVNAGFNPLMVISEKTGKSIAKLTGEMKDGMISSKMMKDAMIDATTGTGRFANNMENLSKSFKGQKEKIREYSEIFWGNFTKPMFDMVASRVMPTIVNYMVSLSEKGEYLGKALMKVTKFTYQVVKSLYDMVGIDVPAKFQELATKFKNFIIAIKDYIKLNLPGLIDYVKPKIESFIEILKKIITINIIPKLRFLKDVIIDLALAFKDLILVDVPAKFLEIKSKIENLASVFKSFMRVMSTGDSNSIKIMLEALLPDSIEGKIIKFIGTFIYWRDNFDSIIKSITNILRSGDSASIGMMIKAFIPDDYDIFIDNFITIFLKLKNTLQVVKDWVFENIPSLAFKFMELVTKVAPLLQDLFLPIIKRFWKALSEVNFDILRQGLSDFGKSVVDLYNAIEPSLKVLAGLFYVFYSAVMGTYGGIIKAVPSLIGAFLSGLSVIMNVITGIIALLNGDTEKVKQILRNTLDAVLNMFEGIGRATVDIFKGLIDGVVGAFQTLYNIGVVEIRKIADAISNGFNKIKDNYKKIEELQLKVMIFIGLLYNQLVAKMTSMKYQVQQIIYQITNDTANRFNWVMDKVVNIVGSLISSVSSRFNTLKTKVQQITYQLTTDTVNRFNWVMDKLVNISGSIISGVSSKFNTLKTTVSNISNSLKSGLSKIWNNMKSTGINTFNSMVSGIINTVGKIGNLSGSAYRWGKNLIDGFINGFKSGIKALTNAVSSVSNTVKNFIGWESPTKKGAGKNSHKWIPNLMEMMIVGFNRYTKKLGISASNVSKSIANNLMTTSSGLNIPVQSGYTNLATRQMNNSISIVVNADSMTNGREVGKILVKELNNLGILTHR